MSISAHVEKAQSSVQAWIRKNRKNYSFLKDCCDKNPDEPISYYIILKNLTELFLKSQVCKSLTPVFLIFLWNSISLHFPEMFDHYIARLCYVVRIVYFCYIMYTIRSRINQKIEDGEMDQQVTVERQEWTNEASMETVPEQLSAGDYDKEQWMSFLKSQGVGSFMSLSLYIKWGYTTPMVVSLFLGYQHIKDLALYRIHVKGESGSEDALLRRPFKQMDLFTHWQKALNHHAVVKQPTKEKKIATKSLKQKEKAKAQAEKKRA